MKYNLTDCLTNYNDNMKIKLCLWFLLLTTLLLCCKKNVKEFSKLTDNLSVKQLEIRDRLEQISIISSVIFAENPDLLNQYVVSVKNKLIKFPQDEESLTFMEILKNASFIEPGFSKQFVKKYLEKFYSSNYPKADKFTLLTEKIKSSLDKIDTKNNSSKITEFNIANNSYSSITDTIFIASYGGQLYFPYSQNFNSVTANQFWYTSDPLSETKTTVEVHKVIPKPYDPTAFPILIFRTVSDEWAEGFPTLVANISDNMEDIERPMNPTPPPPVIQCSNLVYNTISNLDDNYTISNSIPMIRLLENIRYGFWSASNNIVINQAYVKLINPTVNPNTGTLSVDAHSRSVGDIRIKRRDARKKNWVSFGPIWNPNWKMEQKENYMVIAYKKSFISASNITVDYSVKAGITYNPVTLQWIPSFTGNVTASGKISIGKNYGKYGEDWIPRESILTNAVGDFFNIGTTVSENIYTQTPFTIRQLNKFQYYFKTNICY